MLYTSSRLEACLHLYAGHAASGPATAGVGSSSSTQPGTASEQAQLSGRSQAGRVMQACPSLLTELHAYGHNVGLDVMSCRTVHSIHPVKAAEVCMG